MAKKKSGRKEWKVYFNGNFRGHEKGERCSREIPVGKTFFWGKEKWLVPSVYTSPAGLVVDFCVEVAPERIQAFMEKWDLQNGEAPMCEEEEWRQMEAENPLEIPAFPQVILNGRELPEAHGCSVVWNPCIPEEMSGQEARAFSMEEAEEFLEHYGCDPLKGWVFKRYAFGWATKRKPVFRDVRIKLEREPDCFAGKHFTAEKPGQEIVFFHPVTGVEHTLTVKKLTQERLDKMPFDDSVEWPEHYVKMEYTLSPDLPDMEFTVQDCGRGDSPRTVRKKAAAVEIIGGAHGPTSIFLAGKNIEDNHAAFSAVHFEPVDMVEWRMTFHIKMMKDIVVSSGICMSKYTH